MTHLLRTLALPRWRLLLRAALVVLVVALGIRIGLPEVLLVPLGLLLIWGLWWDFSHKPRGGWRAAPMGSFAVVNHDTDRTFLINERGDSVVDQTGRTYAASSRVPTPEEQAAIGSAAARGLLPVAIEVVVLAVLFVLVVALRLSEIRAGS